MESTKREEIVKRLNAIQKQENAVRKELESLDHKERLADATQYYGKYYKENVVSKHNKKYFRCVFVYAVDKKACQPIAMEISYWSDKDDWFSIQNYHHFRVRDYDDTEDKWVEITKTEFDKHYTEVRSRINKARLSYKKKQNGKAKKTSIS